MLRMDGRTDGRTDNVKTVYPLQTKFAGGITKVLKANGSLMKVVSIAEFSVGAFCNVLTCIKQLSVLKTNFALLFHWSLKKGFTVLNLHLTLCMTSILSCFASIIIQHAGIIWNQRENICLND